MKQEREQKPETMKSSSTFDFDLESETVIGPTQRVVVLLSMVHNHGEERARELIKPETERGFLPDDETDARSVGNDIFIEFLSEAKKQGYDCSKNEADIRDLMNDMSEARRLAFRDGVKNLTISKVKKTMKYLILLGDEHWAVTLAKQLLEKGDFWK